MSRLASAARTRSSLATILVGLAGLAACAAPRPPELPIAVAARAGVVHASSAAKARAFADVLDAYAPRIPAVLPGCAARPVDVRLVTKLARENWGGATFTLPDQRWIELPEGEEPQAIAATLVHELVHYELGPDWSTLPGVLEEGLCDLVAHKIVPEAAAIERAEYAVLLASAIDGCLFFEAPRMVGHGAGATFAGDPQSYTVRATIEREDLPSFDEALHYKSRDLEPIRAQGVRGVLDALGYLVVARIGIDDLHALCLRARIQGLHQVPSAWIFGAAGLDPHDHGSWRPAIQALFGEDEKKALLKREGLQSREQR